MSNPIPLSPTTRAVLDAYRSFWLDEPMHTDEECLAAALRAAADQVVPREPHEDTFEYCCDYSQSRVKVAIRAELLAIAAELEGSK